MEKGQITAEKAMEITSLKRTSFYKLVEQQLDEDVSKLAKENSKLRVSDIQRYMWIGYPTAKRAFDKFLEKNPSWKYDEKNLVAKKEK